MTLLTSARRKKRVSVVSACGIGFFVLCGSIAGWNSVAAILSIAVYLVGMWIAMRSDVAEPRDEAGGVDSFDADAMDDG